MRDEWWQHFIQKHPRLEDYKVEFESCFDFAIGPGWFPLVEQLVIDCTQKAKEQGLQFRIHQVKEKFGTLCFYIGADTDEIFDMIRKAEAASAYICEECGIPGKTRYKYNDGTKRGWIVTVCDKHNKRRDSQQ